MPSKTTAEVPNIASTLTADPSGRHRPAPRVCTRCVMDEETNPLIRFDENGVCNHCHEYVDLARRRYFPNEEGAAKLAHLVDSMRRRGKGREYDCIVGISGGVDSTF